MGSFMGSGKLNHSAKKKMSKEKPVDFKATSHASYRIGYRINKIKKYYNVIRLILYHIVASVKFCGLRQGKGQSILFNKDGIGSKLEL